MNRAALHPQRVLVQENPQSVLGGVVVVLIKVHKSSFQHATNGPGPRRPTDARPGAGASAPPKSALPLRVRKFEYELVLTAILCNGPGHRRPTDARPGADACAPPKSAQV